MEIVGKDFNLIYKKLVRYVMETGADVTVRNKETLECTNCLITLNNIDNNHLDFDSTEAYERQDQYEHYRIREIEWYESGCLLAKHAPAEFWKKIANKNGEIQSNYGYLIFHKKKPYTNKNITSYKNVVNLLKKDKYSRQAILHYNLPEHYSANKKDIPCTICTQVIIRNDKLNFFVFQRSADLFFGLPYDIPWHSYLLKKLVHELKNNGLKISQGNLSVFIGSVHIYKENIPFMKKYLTKRVKSHAKKK